LIFPTSVYRTLPVSSDYKAFAKITNPSNETLCLHKPKWENVKNDFLKTLQSVYNNIYNREGIIYISLQNVRDEVCRILRISSLSFEKYLEMAFVESIRQKIPYTISLETDVRKDQVNAFQVQRRSVYVNKIPHSLIAIKA